MIGHLGGIKQTFKTVLICVLLCAFSTGCGSYFFSKRSFVKKGDKIITVKFLICDSNETKPLIDMNIELVDSEPIMLFRVSALSDGPRSIVLPPGKHKFLIRYLQLGLFNVGGLTYPLDLDLVEGSVALIKITRISEGESLGSIYKSKNWLEIKNLGYFLTVGSDGYKENLINVINNGAYILQTNALDYLTAQHDDLSKQILKDLREDPNTDMAAKYLLENVYKSDSNKIK